MKRFKKGLLIYNVQAGGKGTAEQVNIAVSILSDYIEDLSEKMIVEAGGGETICYEEGSQYDVIIILGGDGTVHECINGIARLDTRPAVAILPGGTCNDFARSAYIPIPFEEACHFVGHGTIQSLDVGFINERYFGNFWGIGLIVDTSENIDGTKKEMLGRISYYLSALETIRAPRAFHYTITSGDETYTGEAVMIVALNGNFIGTNELPFKAELDDGKLELVIVKEGGLALIREYLNFRKVKETGEHLIELEHLSVSSFTIETSSPMKMDMDGEVYMVTPGQCRVLPKHIQVVAGQSPVKVKEPGL
ncbi:YegS/Rv2252/BmrU family lipid kinase [Bacillus ectoiniformans]|uniref:diacylglycerol/lipid kinase family protein n=1 Tax=Bacillus ectoiniformans TaxID=1494429 RepID=UPI0019585C61|nr:diacylglycerol kinase family protein [Bacillus ectoiniformans]MBM7649414.1 YegS/Rv2252/BmrU family lipid kinase [Bacillus ectoiniformans]